MTHHVPPESTTNSFEIAFDSDHYCAVIRYSDNLGENYLSETQFKSNDLRGNWTYFKNQIPCDQDLSNIGVIHMIGVHRSEQTKGYGRRALQLAHYLMKKSGVTIGFLEADPYMESCEDDLYQQYIQERTDFYSSEGWQLLNSKEPHPPRPHMWLDFNRIVATSPTGVLYRAVDSAVYDQHLNLSDQEGYRSGTFHRASSHRDGGK